MSKLLYNISVRLNKLLSVMKINIKHFKSFFNKDILEFFKCCKSKFKRKVQKDVQINGSSDNLVIADNSVTHFASTNTDTYTDNVSSFMFAPDHNSTAHNDPCNLSQFSFEIIDKCIHNLKFGKSKILIVFVPNICCTHIHSLTDRKSVV